MEVICGANVVLIDDRGVSVERSDRSSELLPAQEVVLATGFKPWAEKDLRWKAPSAAGSSVEFVPVGDCVHPGNLYDAIHAGFLAGWNA